MSKTEIKIKIAGSLILVCVLAFFVVFGLSLAIPFVQKIEIPLVVGLFVAIGLLGSWILALNAHEEI